MSSRKRKWSFEIYKNVCLNMFTGTFINNRAFHMYIYILYQLLRQLTDDKISLIIQRFYFCRLKLYVTKKVTYMAQKFHKH